MRKNNTIIRTIFLSYAILFLGFGCDVGSSDNDKYDRIIKCSEEDIPLENGNVIQSVDYLVLKTPENCILGGIDKVIEEGDSFYVGDYRSSKIFVFGKDGQMTGVLDKCGRGPEEYLAIQSFTVNNQDLCIMDQFRNSLIIYDRHTLRFKRAKEIPVPAWDFASLNNGGFIFANAPLEGEVSNDDMRYRIFITDSVLQVRHRLFKCKKNERDAFSIRHYLSSCEGCVVFGSLGERGYSLFRRSDGAMLERVGFDFHKPIPEDVFVSASDITDAGYTYPFRAPFLCGEYMALNLMVGGRGKTCLYNRNTGDFSLPGPGPLQNQTMLGIVGCYKDGFIGFWQSSRIYEAMVNNGFQRADPAVEVAINEDSPFLVLYGVKSSIPNT